MARLPRPPKEYSDLAMARELNAAIDASKPDRVALTRHEMPRVTPNSVPQRDYRRTLFESLFT
jgi:hypothetical protein